MNQLSEERARMRWIDSMQKSVLSINAILKNLTQKDAQTWRDGGDGWTVLEVLCHLRDYDLIFRERGELILNEDNSLFLVYDHLALVIENKYNEQNLTAVLAELSTSRQKTVALFTNLDEAGWQRLGQHPSMGAYSMSDLASLTAWHDINHLEQMTRIMDVKE